MENTEQYLERMGNSIPFTTKNLIPDIVNSNLSSIKRKEKKILDVGCADGAFTRYIAERLVDKRTIVDAIEPNYWGYGLDQRKTDGVNYIAHRFGRGFADDGYRDYDGIIFSSVMHEISSYCDNEREQYTKAPIRKAISLAAELLAPGGFVVVRDMIKPPHHHAKSVTVEFKDREAVMMFFKFIQECPYLTKERDKSPRTKFYAYDSGQRIVFNIREDVLMEFLMVHTWGVQSFPREVQERKFILDRGDWDDAFRKAGLKVTSVIATNEEYPKYFDRIVKVWDPNWNYPETTCLIVAKKEGD